MSAVCVKRILILRFDHRRSGDSPSFLRASGQEAPHAQCHRDDGVFHVVEKLKQGFHCW